MDGSSSKKSINRDIFHLIIPAVLENVLQLLAGVVTTAMVGRLLADDISAQGISNRIYQTCYALFRGLGMGSTVLVATYFGARNYGKCRRIIEQAFLAAMPIALIMSVIISLFPAQILGIFTSDQALIQTAISYSRITAWAIPFMVLITFNAAAFNGQGNAKVPMFIALILNFVNVGVGYVAIFGIGPIGGFGITGAAIATVVSQATGAALGLFLLYGKKGLFRRTRHDFKFFSVTKADISSLFSTGMPAAAENLFWQLSAIIISKVILDYGSNYYAAYQLGLQAEMLTEMPAAGFIVAATTLSARAIGERNPELFRAYYKQMLKMASIIAVAASAALFLFPGFFMAILTDKPDLQAIGTKYVFCMGFAQISQVMSKVYNGVIRSAGGKRVPMYISFIGIWIIRVPLVVLFGWILKWDIVAIWMVIAVDQVSRMILSLVYMKRKDIAHYVDRLIASDKVTV